MTPSLVFTPVAKLMTENHLQPVAALIICHTEADLHADCTCMNAHTHSHVLFVLLSFLRFILPDNPSVLGVFLVEFCKVSYSKHFKYPAPNTFNVLY